MTYSLETSHLHIGLFVFGLGEPGPVLLICVFLSDQKENTSGRHTDFAVLWRDGCKQFCVQFIVMILRANSMRLRFSSASKILTDHDRSPTPRGTRYFGRHWDDTRMWMRSRCMCGKFCPLWDVQGQIQIVINMMLPFQLLSRLPMHNEWGVITCISCHWKISLW